VEKLAEGRVFTGRMAKEAGLVDRLGTLDDAIDEARQLAGIATEEEVDRILLPEPRGLFDDLFGDASGGEGRLARLVVGTGAALPLRAALVARVAGLPGLEFLAADADTLVALLSGRPQMMMPGRIRLR
jgi:protease-4